MILITGANGLVGSYLVRKLIDRGERVRAIKRPDSRLTLLEGYAAKVEWADGDVTDIFSLEEAMQGVSQLYHCAAMISMRPTDQEKMMHINAEGTANVVNAALGSGIKKMLYVSSVAAFGRPDFKGRLIDENLDIRDSKDNFSYYKSKLYAEREVWRGIAEGLNAVIINPSTILGGGFWSVQPNSLFDAVYKGMPFFANGSNGFVDVRDVVSAAVQLMETDITAEKFILSAGNMSFKDLMNHAADALHVRRPFLNTGRLLGAFAWRASALANLFSTAVPVATRDSIAIAGIDFRYSNEKIKKAIGFNFRPLEQSIAEVGNAYLRSKSENIDYAILP